MHFLNVMVLDCIIYHGDRQILTLRESLNTQMYLNIKKRTYPIIFEVFHIENLPFKDDDTFSYRTSAIIKKKLKKKTDSG